MHLLCLGGGGGLIQVSHAKVQAKLFGRLTPCDTATDTDCCAP